MANDAIKAIIARDPILVDLALQGDLDVLLSEC
jgi:hypothetical protein